MIFIFCNLLYTLHAQPCTTPQTLIGTTQVSGSCASDIASTTATDFNLAALGGSTLNNGVTQFAIAMWIQPGKTSSEAIATYTLFRVTTDAADTTPSSTKGVRFSAFISSHTTDSLKRGFQLGYSETPSDYLVMTDITQFLISFNYNWMYVYAALNYDTGDMQLTVWQSSETFYKQQTYQASKVNFNDPLDDNTMINVMYWGSYLRYCGNMVKVKWMPGYYETMNDNILTLAYFLEGQTNNGIYLFRFDTEDAGTATNLIDSSTVTVTGTQTNAYYEITPTDRTVPISGSGLWSYTTKSYTFGIHFLFKQLPVFGQDIIIFQRKNGGTNKLSIKFARQADGKIGILLVLQSTSQLIYSSLMNQDQYYYLLLSMSFKDSVLGQTNVLVHYSLVGQDGDFTKHGFVFGSYTTDFSTQMVAADTVTLGSIANIYPNSVYVRNFRFTEGFEAFIGVPTDLANCLANCVIGFYTQITTDTDYCLICDTTTKLDSDYQCVSGQCSANYYPLSDLVSQSYCGYCLTTSYYVSIAETCIAAVCGNGFKEALEQCDDGNLVTLDGCDGSCDYEAGWICNAIAFQLSDCQKQCGNGQEDTGDTGNGYPTYSEACDDGNTTDNDGCSSSCSIESNLWECLPYFPTVCTQLCGNSIINNNVGLSQTEQCDDGNQVSGDGCDNLCQIESGWYCNLVGSLSSCNRICGNGLIDAGETCDDGNLADNDGCTNCSIDTGYVCASSICTKLCGNGVVDVTNSEICDDGNTVDFDGCFNCVVNLGWNCVGTSPTICQLCGNGKREGTETCDDGNVISLDGCSLGCNIESGWSCNGNSPDQCKNCGDGKKQQIEDCDDGNSLSGDGCYNCLIEANFQCSGGSPSTPDICIRQCPNGIVAANEQCDDGNFVSGDGCFNCLIESGYVCVNQPSICNLDICGNGLSNNPLEQCDDGNILDDDGCSSSCLIETGWQCSGQNYQTKSTCTPICGDAKKLSQEQCDDGNLIDNDGCSQLCKLELSYECAGGNITTPDTCIMTCGNNLRTGIEECDDGNLRNGDGCSSLCQIETTFGCVAMEMQDGVMRDECFKCVTHCALCTDTTIDSCTLCQQGYYKSLDDCTDTCDIGYYPDFSTQQCTKCQDNCNRCYSTTQCYNCADKLVLSGTNCVDFCDDGYWVKSDDIKGNWCKKCPDYCLTCDSDTQCTKCADYYGIDGLCQSCQMGDLCLSCDFTLNHCTNCQLGYRPIKNTCIVITDKCGDGLVSLNEPCDDSNLVNGDGCSRECTIEDGHNCRLLSNQGPSQCFNIDGWDFTLQTFILDPTIVLIHFRDQLQYHEKILTNFTQVFAVSISGYSSGDFTYQFVNVSSNQSLQIKFTFLKNVVSQSLTVNVIDQTLLFNEYDIFINPNKISVSIDLEDVEYYSDTQMNNFEFFAQVCLGLQIVNWILTVGAGFLGQKMRMWKIIEIMQIIAVMYYINLRSYPMNDELILKDLRMSNLQILPNYVEQNTDEYLDSLRRFSYAGMTHQVLNNMGGRFILSLGISIGGYLVIKIIYYKYIFFVFEVFLDKLEFSYFFKLYEIFLLELLIGCFHNLKYNSMASNWDGTNTVCSLLILLFIFLFQVTQFLVMFFRDKFGTADEVDLMFGTLTDGFQDHDKKRRVYLSQQDFVKKFFIAFAAVYVNDPFEQLLFIIVPRAIITVISVIIMQSWFIRVKEIISELLLYGIFGIVYLLALGNYIGDLDTKVFYGYLWEYLVIAVLALHFFIDTYLVWKLLQDLEFAFPAVFDPSAGLNKNVDLFKLRPGKDKKALPAIFQEDMDKKVGEDEEENRRRQKFLDEQNKKNQNREQWNVWDMNREALPEERKFVSINHNELNPYGDPQQEQMAQEEIINFDELDQFYDNPAQNNNQFGITNNYNNNNNNNNNNNDQSKDDDSSGIKDNPFDF